MNDQDLWTLARLLQDYRDKEAVDRAEFDKRDSLLFDVQFDLTSRGLPLVPSTEKENPHA